MRIRFQHIYPYLFGAKCAHTHVYIHSYFSYIPTYKRIRLPS